MEINIINVPYLGDLYRFYVRPNGRVVEVHFFALMGTAHKVLDKDEIPRVVNQLFEDKFIS